MRTLSLALASTLAASQALACAPAPSCWISSGDAYLRGVCRGYADKQISQIAQWLDEPEKIDLLVRACARVHAPLRR